MPTKLESVVSFEGEGLGPPKDAAKNPTAVVAFWLGRDIIRGVFAPDERLAADQLAGFYNVTYSAMREAILMLSSSKLITHEHQKGYRAAPVSLADWHDVVSVYQRIYKLTLEFAVLRGDNAWEERVVLALHRLMKVEGPPLDADAPRLERWQRARRELHDEVRSGARSPWLTDILGDLSNVIERYINLFGDRSGEQARDYHAEHRMIVDALVARDLARLEKVIDGYFAIGEHVRASVEARLAAMEDVGGSKGEPMAEVQSLPPPTPKRGRPRGAVTPRAVKRRG